MGTQGPPQLFCPKCCAVLDADDHFCRRCGESTEGAAHLVDVENADVPTPSATPSVPPRPRLCQPQPPGRRVPQRPPPRKACGSC